MAKLSPEHAAFAVTVLEKLFRQRQLNQTWLAAHSGIDQSEISRIFRRQKDPTKKELEQLFEALGIPLSEIISTVDALPENLLVYVATPLTGFTNDQARDLGLRNFIARIADILKRRRFEKPDFRLYWPGDHTHPVNHAHVPAKQVYITDRSRSSSYDLVVMLCIAPSFGIGQENEIATQAGVPAIRLVPKSVSRMMTGSFLKSWDIPYKGMIENGIRFSEADFLDALVEIRKLYFVHQALFRGLATFGFGERLQHLVDDRIGNRKQFAEQLGVDAGYLEAMFSEPLVVSNPSSILLMRMAKILNVSVSYLLWEAGADDPAFKASMASWKAWVSENGGLDARTAVAIRENWAEEYQLHRYANSGTAKKGQEILMKDDWSALYSKCHASGAGSKQIKQELSRYIFREANIAIVNRKDGQSISRSSKEHVRSIVKKRGTN